MAVERKPFEKVQDSFPKGWREFGPLSAPPQAAREQDVAQTPSGGGTGSTTSASFATPAIALSTTAAAGSGSLVIRHNSTIAAFDGTNPVTQAFGDSAATGSVAFAARRDHKHGMPSQPASAVNATFFVPVSGRYYASLFGNSSWASLASTNQTRSAIPFTVPDALTIDRIGVQNITTSSGTVFRLGIYNDNGTAGNHYPGTLLLDAGTVTAGAAGFLTITINQALAAGLYWLCVHVTSASGNTRCRTGGAPTWPSLGYATSLVENTNGAFVQTGIAAAVLPNPFPSSVNIGDGTSNIPEVVVRVA